MFGEWLFWLGVGEVFCFGEMLSLLMAWSNFDLDVGEPMKEGGLDRNRQVMRSVNFSKLPECDLPNPKNRPNIPLPTSTRTMKSVYRRSDVSYIGFVFRT